MAFEFEPWINFNFYDQSVIEEDSYYWPEVYKNYVPLADWVQRSPERYAELQQIHSVTIEEDPEPETVDIQEFVYDSTC